MIMIFKIVMIAIVALTLLWALSFDEVIAALVIDALVNNKKPIYWIDS